MKFILIPEQRKDDWNAFVARNAHSSFTQSYEWGAVKSGTWQPFYCAVTGTHDEILAAALVLKRKFPVVPHCILYCPRGPLFSEFSGELAAFFFNELKLFSGKIKAVLFRCDPEIPEADNAALLCFQGNGLKPVAENVQPRATIVLDIRPSADILLQSFHHKTRYNIKLAQKKGVVIREAESKNDVDIFYDLFRLTSERDQFLILQKSYFYHLWDTLHPKSLCAIFIAEYEGRPLAAIFQTLFGSKMTYVYGASSNEHRNLMPNHLIHWHAIQWAKERQIYYYDFWGIPSHPHEQHPLWGVYRFKKGFCDVETRWIGTYEIVFSPFWKGLFTHGSKAFKKVIRLIRTGSLKTPLEE